MQDEIILDESNLILPFLVDLIHLHYLDSCQITLKNNGYVYTTVKIFCSDDKVVPKMIEAGKKHRIKTNGILADILLFRQLPRSLPFKNLPICLKYLGKYQAIIEDYPLFKLTDCRIADDVMSNIYQKCSLLLDAEVSYDDRTVTIYQDV